MIEYSVVTAVHTMWLAARAEGIGFGWVSILDPSRMAEILDVPPDWHPHRSPLPRVSRDGDEDSRA
jgi:nitroreductase